MDYYGNNDWRTYLAHHGILGMKWGRRNGPPYPLGVSDHSASEKKAGWRKSLGGGESTTIRKKARYVSKESKKIDKYYKKDIKKTEKATARAEKKYRKAVEKGSSRADRLKERYRDSLADSESLKRTKEKELERVRNMTLKEIKDEKARTKDLKKQLNNRISDDDGFFERAKKSRENKKELQELKSESRVTKGERNQIKDDVKSSSKNIPSSDKVLNALNSYKKMGDEYDGDDYFEELEFEDRKREARNKVVDAIVSDLKTNGPRALSKDEDVIWDQVAMDYFYNTRHGDESFPGDHERNARMDEVDNLIKRRK